MKSSLKLANFTGEDIYLGIDVHLKSWKVSIYLGDIEHKTFSQPPEAEQLARYLERHFPGGTYHCVYEAGFSGFYIQRELEALGMKCMVIHPADVPTMDKEKRQKSDRVDCRKLARSLKNGDLEALYVPGEELEQDRALVRHRHNMVSKRTRVKNQIKFLLMQIGVGIPQEFKGRNWTKGFVQWLGQLEFKHPTGTQVIRSLHHELNNLSASIKLLDQQIKGLSQQPRYADQVRLMMSIPSVGLTSAMSLLTEIGDISRFKTLDQLCAYVGLIPNTNSSGENERIGRLTKRGNKHLRYILIECAWMAIGKDPALGLKFKQLTKKMEAQKAIIRIAKKLLNRIRAVLKNRTEYTIGVLQ